MVAGADSLTAGPAAQIAFVLQLPYLRGLRVRGHNSARAGLTTPSTKRAADVNGVASERPQAANAVRLDIRETRELAVTAEARAGRRMRGRSATR